MQKKIKHLKYCNGMPRLIVAQESRHGNETHWSKREKKGLENRILRLFEDQIGALIEICGLAFNENDLDEVVNDIKTNGLLSGHLEILLGEAESKNKLLFWLGYFEKTNRQYPR